MLWIGLTGGLGSGKSTVAQLLRDRGVNVIDADEMARLAVGPGSKGLDQIVQKFGTDVQSPDGSLNRAALAEIVFGDSVKLAELEAIIHPVVRELTAAARAKAEAAGAKIAFYDVPLLYEKNMSDQFDAVVVVNSGLEVQIERAMSRDGFTRDQVLARVNSQLPLAEKVRRADFVIQNTGAMSDLIPQVETLLKKFAGSPAPGRA